MLDSLFVPLDLADSLRIEAEPASGPVSEVAFTLRGAADAPSVESVPADASNLAVRAAEAFAARGGRPLRVAIELDKRIPTGAGLGGGSSDAAAVLRALDAKFPRELEPGELAEVALGLGADVPYFLDPRPAWVSGIGERIEAAAGVPALPCVLANPGVSVATAAVYAGFDAAAGALTTPGPRPTMPALFGPSGSGALQAALRNDLEPAASALCPAIPRLKARLGGLGARAVGMSGSGATVYGVFESREQAAEAHLALQASADAGLWAAVAQTAGSTDP